MALPHPVVPPGGPPEPPAAPQAGAAAAAPVRPRTYRELLNDEANGPPPERIANFLAGYRFEGVGGIPTPATLRDLTITLSDRQPVTFLCLVPGPGNAPEVTVLHRLMRYMDMPGEEPSGYHDRVLGLLGDIMPHQYPTVEVPGTVFHLLANPVRVPTTDGMTALLPAWDDPGTPLGPFLPDDAETEVVRTRGVQVVPGYVAALLVHRRGVNAKQAYQEIQGLLQARGELQVCADILTWLRAACAARGGGGAANGMPAVLHPLAPVHLPGVVYRYMTSKVRGDLPALAEPDPTATEMTGTLVGALRALTGARPDAGHDGRTTSREPKKVQDAYKETYRTLLRFCNVTQPEDVAPVWSRLANCTKSEQHTILTQEFQRVCMSRGLGAELYTPVVTAALKQMIVGFQFVGYGVDDLATGCQPFLVTYTGSANQLEALATASLNNQLAQGEHSASLDDYRTIREKETVRFPKDIMEVGITLGRYAVL